MTEKNNIIERQTWSSEIKTDVKLLLECLKYHGDNPVAVKQALLTLVSIFADSDSSIKDHFRSTGGLHFVFSLLQCTTNTEVQEVILYCIACAIENNVFSQKQLTTDSTFKLLHKLLTTTHCSTRLKQTAAFFLISLVSNNGVGQTLARKFLCLSDLLALLKSALPNSADFGGKESWFEDVGSTCLELWSSVTSALCICMNNPQNDENQRLCGLELPFMFTVMLQYTQPAVINPLLSLVGFIVSNNQTNQERVRRCGGLQVLCSWLNQTLQSDTCTSYQLAVHIINTVDSCITDNADCAFEVSKMSLMSNMIEVLDKTDMNTSNKLKVVVSIGHAIELSEKNRDDLVKELGGLECLIHQLTLSEDEEFSRAVKYVLQLCVEKDPCEKEEKMKSDATDSRREEGMMILKKINEMSDRLRNIQEEASQNYKVINDMMSPWHHRGPPAKYSSVNLNKPTCNQNLNNTSIKVVNAGGFSPDALQSQENISNFDKSKMFAMLCTDNHARKSTDYILNNKSYQGLADVFKPTHVGDVDHYNKSQAATMYPGSCINMLTPLDSALLQQLQTPPNVGFGADYQFCQAAPDDTRMQKENENMELRRHYDFRTPAHQRMSYRGDATPNCPVKKCKNVTSYNQSPCNVTICQHTFTPNTQSKKELFPNSSPYCRELVSDENFFCKTCMNQQQTPGRTSYDSLSRGQKMVMLLQASKPDQQKTPKQSSGHQHIQNMTCSCDVSIQQQKAPRGSQILNTDSVEKLKKQDIDEKNRSVHSNKETKASKRDEHMETKFVNIPIAVEESFQEFKKPTKPAPRVRKRSCSSVRHATPLWSVATQCRGFEIYRDPDISDTCSEAASEFDTELILTAGAGNLTPRDCVRNGVLHQTSTSHTCRSRTHLSDLNISSSVTPKQHDIHSKVTHTMNETLSNRGRQNVIDITDEEGLNGKESFNLNDNHSCQTDNSEDVSDSSSKASMASSFSYRREDCGKRNCIGCSGGALVGDTRLNSRTLNILLETNPYTCRLHRELRQLERNYISQLRKHWKQEAYGKSYLRSSWKGKENQQGDVYDFPSDSDGVDVSPPRTVLKKNKIISRYNKGRCRKGRMPYTEEEVQNLQEGVRCLGKFWTQILATYRFHPSRTGVHLKDKYKQIQRQKKEDQSSCGDRAHSQKPFSMCEERRLLKGVKAFGYNWKSILQSYKFAEGRTNEDLRNKWRSMNRNQTPKT